MEAAAAKKGEAEAVHGQVVAEHGHVPEADLAPHHLGDDRRHVGITAAPCRIVGGQQGEVDAAQHAVEVLQACQERVRPSTVHGLDLKMHRWLFEHPVRRLQQRQPH